MKNLGKPIIMGTGGEIKKTGLYETLRGTTTFVFPKYSKKTIEDALKGVFLKNSTVNDEKYRELVKLQTSCTYINVTYDGIPTLYLSGKEIFRLHKNYLAKVTKFVIIWETENHMKRLSENI